MRSLWFPAAISPVISVISVLKPNEAAALTFPSKSMTSEQLSNT